MRNNYYCVCVIWTAFLLSYIVIASWIEFRTLYMMHILFTLLSQFHNLYFATQERINNVNCYIIFFLVFIVWYCIVGNQLVQYYLQQPPKTFWDL